MSIFDDDQAESVATARADKKAHKNPFADPEERLEPLMHEGSELDDDELALEEEEFVPLDRKRNRHLSSSLDKIRDNGPASTAREPAPQEDVKPAPAPKASPQPQEARNPFAGSEASTAEPKPAPVNNPFLPPTAGTSPKPRTKPAANRQASHDKIFAGEKLTIEKPRSRNTEPDDTSPAPQKKPRQAEQPRQRPQPRPETAVQEAPRPEARPTPPPPEFARRQQPSIGVSSLTLWTLLAMAVLLAAWSMIQLSGLQEQLADLKNQVQQLEQPAIANNSGNDDARLARLENNYQALESRLQQLPKNNDSKQAESVAQLQKQLGQLQQQHKTLQSNLAALKQPAKATTAGVTSATATTTAKPSGWVINIASLSNRDNAFKLAGKAKLLGADCRVESYPSQGRTLYRVRAFGYNSQNAAEKDALRLQNGLNISGLIVRKID